MAFRKTDGRVLLRGWRQQQRMRLLPSVHQARQLSTVTHMRHEPSRVQQQRVPILIYHHVYPEGSAELQKVTFETGSGVIGETEFRRHMDFIRDEGWSVIGTSDVISWVQRGGRDPALPEKAAVLHFDNGWLDTFTVVAPILQEYGFTATLFPITDGLEAASSGRTAAVRTRTEGVVSKPFMTWEQARAMQDVYGWEMGGHTATHCKVADHHAEHGDAGVMQEAEVSNGLFEKHLGKPPSHFAYPSGSRTNRTDELLLADGRGSSGCYDSLRLWEVVYPIEWKFTDASTPLHSIEGQNIDLRVNFDEFTKIFELAEAP